MRQPRAGTTAPSVFQGLAPCSGNDCTEWYSKGLGLVNDLQADFGRLARGIWAIVGMDSCSPFPQGQASQERRWNHVVPAQRDGFLLSQEWLLHDDDCPRRNHPLSGDNRGSRRSGSWHRTHTPPWPILLGQFANRPNCHSERSTTPTVIPNGAQPQLSFRTERSGVRNLKALILH